VSDTAPLGRSERSHCRSKQLHARLATRGGRISPALAFADGPAEHTPFRQSSEINISLIITKFAKW